MKRGAYADAVASYDWVANFYGGQGFALKAMAIYKQILTIASQHPEIAPRCAHVTAKIGELERELGLSSGGGSGIKVV